jgi:type IV pilus assembly protein PilB
MNRKRLGELLVEAGVIGMEQLNYALTLKQRFHSEKLGQILMSLRYIDRDTLIEFLGKQCGVPSIDPSKEVIDEEAVYMIPMETAKKYKVLAIRFKLEGKTKKLIVAMVNPLNLKLIDTIAFITGYSIEPVFAREEDLDWVILYYYNKRTLFYPKRK